MPLNTNAERKMSTKIKLLLLLSTLAVCLLLLYFVPVSESVQKISPYTHFTSGGITQDSGEMQLDLRYRRYLIKPDSLVGIITLTSQADGQQRVVDIDHAAEAMPLWGHIYDEASGEYISALIYCTEDFDTVYISIGDDLYYDPANGTITQDILNDIF